MTTQDRAPSGDAAGKASPEMLELRARPQPVTRINRKIRHSLLTVLIGLPYRRSPCR
jgi:hypothetical protein